MELPHILNLRTDPFWTLLRRGCIWKTWMLLIQNRLFLVIEMVWGDQVHEYRPELYHIIYCTRKNYYFVSHSLAMTLTGSENSYFGQFLSQL